MKKIIMIAIVGVTVGIVVGLFIPSTNAQTSVRVNKLYKTIDYGPYNMILSEYVNDQGRVNYEGILSDRSEFDNVVQMVENMDVNQLSPEGQKAFWINAYNAITLKVILDNYPVRSIRSIDFFRVWDVKRKIAGQYISLGHVEHKIIRPMGDPRIHFAINCASIGCPNLPNKPFYPATLNEQLDFETKRFINDPEKVRLDKSKKILYFSAIFDWFEEDFLEESRNLKEYILKYINQEDKEFILNNKIKMKKLKYDWGLNKQ